MEPADIITGDYLTFILIFLGSVILAEAFRLVFVRYAKKLAGRTKSTLDDAIILIVARPLFFLIIASGLYLGLRSITAFADYGQWIDRIYFICAVLAFSYMVSRTISLLMSSWLRVQRRYEKTPQLLTKIVTVVIYLIAFLVILGYFNIDITPLIATLGIGGLAVGLALQNTLSNFFAGIHIISDKPITVGNYVELEGGISGTVEDIGWRSTRIRTLPNNTVIVPNAKLAESVITNFSLPDPQSAVLVQCGVDYGSDLERVEKVTVEVARSIQNTVPGAVRSFDPFIRFNSFGDSNINFTVILRAEEYVDKHVITHEFVKALKAAYDLEGIEISWPVRKVYRMK
ncbi:MAG: mechanosensitive ion channel family protein [Candidatus Altiarchaeota archaeon]|nr:mechanosensitive ion channel family protein [Candidatus Altiarchaeota archaeon]